VGRVSDAKQRLMEAVQELLWTSSYGSTTVDHICEKAQVKKGSFYHFFEDKASLAEAALDADWVERRRFLDAMFSPTVPPLERIRNYCEQMYRTQVESKAKYGKVLGCPLCTLGSEVCTQEARLREKIHQIMDQYRRYLESAIRDAHAEGLIHAPDAAAKTRIVNAYHDGLLAQARILNDVQPLIEITSGTLELLGSRETPGVGEGFVRTN